MVVFNTTNAYNHPVEMMSCHDDGLACVHVCMCEVAAGCGSIVKVDRWLAGSAAAGV